MKNLSPSLLRSLAVRSAVAAAAVVACSGASAVSSFTFTPSAFGAASPAVVADTLIVADFALVTATSSTFTENGYLSVSSFQNAGTFASAPGLNSTYGVYVKFTAMGTIAANPLNNNLTSLSYSVYGYTGAPATFGATAAGATKSLTPSEVLIGTGTLLPGINPFGAYIIGGVAYGSFVTANSLTFSNSGAAFSPVVGASGQFANTAGQMVVTPTGFVVNGGGGSINLVAAPVPEPETYALMLGGLAAVGFVARRRSNG